MEDDPDSTTFLNAARSLPCPLPPPLETPTRRAGSSLPASLSASTSAQATQYRLPDLSLSRMVPHSAQLVDSILYPLRR